MTTEEERERLLSVLNAYGQQFVTYFDIPASSKDKGKISNARESDEDEEEWTGCASDSSELGSDEHNDHDGGDDFAVGSSRTTDVIVFSEPRRKPPDPQIPTKELRKSFMSSKITNITLTSTEPPTSKKNPSADLDDDLTNAHNDALLHRLIHTKLLSGSLNPELELGHAQREKALGGRVLELSGKARLGKGERMFLAEEHNKAAKHVREGLLRKRQEQEKKALEEAKSLGNYHPSLKRLYDSTSPSGQKKKRARGLGMGVGKFAGGTLKLSRNEIVSVTESGKQSGKDKHQRRPSKR